MKSHPQRLLAARAVARAIMILVLVVMAAGATPASAARDRTPPTKPTNLHVTAKTSFSVSLAWSPSTDNSGSFSYVIRASNGNQVTVGQSSTSYTWDTGLLAGYSYSFYVYAVDAAGNRSKNSNTVNVTLPADHSPPSAPVLSVTGVSPTQVFLSWTASAEDGPYVVYAVYMNGSLHSWAGPATTYTIPLLTPDTTYTFSVVARDNWQNFSPHSNTVSATTAPADSSDTSPPTTPTNLRVQDMFCGEVDIRWNASTDNVEPPETIRYDIAVNGIFDHSVAGRTRTITYGLVTGDNTFTVTAVDSAGNASAPAVFTLPLEIC